MPADTKPNPLTDREREMLEALRQTERTMADTVEYLDRRKANEQPKGNWGWMLDGILECSRRELAQIRAAIARATPA